MFRVERASTSAATPLTIVTPAKYAVPPEYRYVFVDDCESSLSQHPAHFIQDQPRILRVMQHVTKQHRVEALVHNRKVPAIVRQVVNASRCIATYIQSHYSRAEHALQMMRDETVATADVEHSRARRQHLRDFARHVISTCGLAAPSHALDATFDSCGQSCHRA